MICLPSDIGAMQVFGVAEKASFLWTGIKNFLGGWERAVVVDAGNFLGLITRGNGAILRPLLNKARIEAGGDGAHRGTELLDGFGVFKTERFAVALFGREPAGVNAGIEAEDEQCFGAVVGEVVVHVAIDADENRNDREQRRNADDHTEHGEKRAHFVLTQCGECHLRVFADMHAHPR